MLALLFHSLRKSGAAIMVINNHDIFAAATGGHRETASLIGCNFPCELYGLVKYFVGANTESIRSSWQSSRRFGGANLLAILL